MRTPFSDIDLDGYSTFNESLSTMGIELDEAVLVVRGKSQGREVEFMVGSLRTEGTRNGMVVIHHQEHDTLSFSGSTRLIRRSEDEYRILLDCELLPDKNGHAFTIRMQEEQK